MSVLFGFVHFSRFPVNAASARARVRHESRKPINTRQKLHGLLHIFIKSVIIAIVEFKTDEITTEREVAAATAAHQQQRKHYARQLFHIYINESRSVGDKEEEEEHLCVRSV